MTGSNEVFVADKALGHLWKSFGIQITDNGNVKQNNYILTVIRDALVDFKINAITILDPTNMTTDISGNTLMPVATVQKGWLYLKLKGGIEAFASFPLKDLFRNQNTPPLILGADIVDLIDWPNSYVQWGTLADIPDADIGKYFYFQIACQAKVVS